jgi:hypothetical protein
MAATGHATVYEWSCKKGRAVAGKALARVDPQGFIADKLEDASLGRAALKESHSLIASDAKQ